MKAQPDTESFEAEASTKSDSASVLPTLAPGARPERYGIVDLGSNTARLVVFTAVPSRWYRLVDAIRERIRLAEGMGEDRILQPKAIDRAVAALQLFADYASARELSTLEVIATSAVREAANRDELLARIEPLNLRLRILSGEEEAAFGVAAVANGLDLDDAWVVDLGGGSAQLSRMSGRECQGGTAFPLGAVRLTEQFFGKADPPKKKQIRTLESFIDDQLDAVTKRMRKDELSIVAMGGTVRNLARIAQRTQRYPLPILHGFVFDRALLEAVIEQLLSVSLEQRAQISGLNADRADVIVAGALVFRRLLELSGRDRIVISGLGIREGAFFRHFLPEPHRVESVRRFGLENTFAQYRQPAHHTAKVREHSLSLFDQLMPLHQLGPADRELLEAGAVLHDIGMTIGYYQHHRHGAELLNTTALTGFSHREQAIIALLVRFHRKGTPQAGRLQSLLDEGDVERLQKLAVFLRLAEQLERSRTGRIREIEAAIEEDCVVLSLHSKDEPTIELWEAAKHAPLFQSVYRRPLELVWHPPTG